MRTFQTLAAITLAATCWMVHPASASGQEVDVMTRLAARKAGAEALGLYDRGKYEEALAKFEEANDLVPAPTLGLRAARCLAKLGRLVEAAERYDKVAHMPIPASAPFVHKQATVEALSERDELIEKIPKLTLDISGEPDEVLLDGKPVPVDALADVRWVDPGEHDVEARRGDAKVAANVSIREGETRTVTLKLPSIRSVSDEDDDDDDDDDEGPRPAGDPTLVLVRWVALGVGAGGFVAGVSHSFAALAQRDAVLDNCPNAQCPPDFHGSVDTLDFMRAMSTIGFVVGALGAGTGVTLWILEPADVQADVGLQVAPLGPASLGVTGSF